MLPPSTIAYTAYRYEPNLGERLNDNIRLGLFMLDFTQNGKTQVVGINPSNIDNSLAVFFRQATLAPRRFPEEPIILYAVGSSLLSDGRRLGAIVRRIRFTKLFRANHLTAFSFTVV